jgi:3-oxoisoapionate decarboxylase
MALPPHPSGRLPAGLCIFGMTYSCGLTWSGTPRANATPLSAAELIDLAAANGLSWLEIPVRMLGEGAAALREARAFAEERGIRFIVPGGKVQAEPLLRDLQVAAELGAPTVRCTLSGILCGDRRGFEGGWQNHLRLCEEQLEKIVPEAERLRVAIALENHQDAGSEDLLALCGRFESSYLGVTLDTGNPLAVMEEPLEFARRIGPYLRHAHLKDYRVYHAPNGCRLARCAMGEGVIDFSGLFQLFDAQEWPITRNIEMGALQVRQIPFLERSWWDEFAPRDARDLLPALSLIWRNLRSPDEEWRTPYEREASGEELAEYEREQLHRSVQYLRTVMHNT